jgi:hypothetical protein
MIAHEKYGGPAITTSNCLHLKFSLQTEKNFEPA